MIRQTVFSPCSAYRYALWREWIGGSGYAMFVGLNPSTADETQDDPTIYGGASDLQRHGAMLDCA